MKHRCLMVWVVILWIACWAIPGGMAWGAEPPTPTSAVHFRSACRIAGLYPEEIRMYLADPEPQEWQGQPHYILTIQTTQHVMNAQTKEITPQRLVFCYAEKDAWNAAITQVEQAMTRQQE